MGMGVAQRRRGHRNGIARTLILIHEAHNTFRFFSQTLVQSLPFVSVNDIGSIQIAEDNVSL